MSALRPIYKACAGFQPFYMVPCRGLKTGGNTTMGQKMPVLIDRHYIPHCKKCKPPDSKEQKCCLQGRPLKNFLIHENMSK
ncbi:MAG: hypothetical protein DRH32_01890 [Deltaproteobacteria bacterium]|nr:MAG: hypothetical protein DRH32_01890 [Deltaproteobacteria bacterium]